MKRIAMGVVCLLLMTTISAQVVPHTKTQPYSVSVGHNQPSDLIKAKTIKATGIVLTLAGVTSTAIGIDKVIRRSKYTITDKNKSVFVLINTTPDDSRSGKNYIIAGAVATIIGIPTWYAGTKKMREIRLSSGPGKEVYVSFSPPTPTMTPDLKPTWMMHASLRF